MREENEAVLIGWDTRLKHCTDPDRMGYEDEGLLFSDWLRQENEAFTVRLLAQVSG